MIIERRTAIAKCTTKVVEKVILLFSISPFPSVKVMNRCVPEARVLLRKVNIVTIPATTLLIP